MRPRSWCSCARPKRSACSITITLALGTSTPTSITVVETRMRVSPATKAAMAASLSRPGIWPCSSPTLVAEKLAQRLEALLRRGDVERVGFLHQRADPIDLRAGIDRAPDRADDLVIALERDRPRHDRLAARRLLGEHRDVHVAEPGQRQRARDRRRRHHQDVDGLALGAEQQALMHAEAVLLVDHGEREIAEGDALLEQRMGADGDRRSRHSPARRARARRPGALLAAGQQGELQPGRLRERRQPLGMLARQDFGRRHQHGLPAGLGGGCHRQQRDHRLAGADIALQQPQHALGLLHVVMDIGDRLALAFGQREGQGGSRSRVADAPSPAVARPALFFCCRRTSASAIWLASSSS